MTSIYSYFKSFQWPIASNQWIEKDKLKNVTFISDHEVMFIPSIINYKHFKILRQFQFL